MSRPRFHNHSLTALAFFTIFALLLAIRSLRSVLFEPDACKPTHTCPAIWSQHEARPLWLIATSTPALAINRRSIIRSTWQNLFRNDTLFTARFVLARPDSIWRDVIEQENATYGDITILDHIEESAHIANTIKSVEMLKHFTSQTNLPYSFVSKIDDDSFLDANAFYHRYLVPLLHNTIDQNSYTVIARELKRGSITYPGGQFYTLTWPLARQVARLHDLNPIKDEHEDVLVGRLLSEAGLQWNSVQLDNQVAFDYDGADARVIGEEQTAWAKEGADLNAWTHAVGKGAINPHKMRTDDDYLRVAACYESSGLKSIT